MMSLVIDQDDEACMEYLSQREQAQCQDTQNATVQGRARP